MSNARRLALVLAVLVIPLAAAPAALAGPIVPSSGVYLGAFANESGFFDSISPRGYDFRLIANPALLAAFTALGQEPDMRAMP